MLAIAANNFDQPSETFIRGHVKHIAPGRTVLLCQDDGGATELGCPVLSDVWALAKPRSSIERIANGLRYRWSRYVDPALRGSNEARVRTFLQRHGVRAVLAEFGNNGSLLRAACKRANVPLYVHFHGGDATKVERRSSTGQQYQRLFRDAAGIIAPSQFLADRLKELGCPENKLHISPNGIDIAQFPPTSREYGRVIAVSRLVPVKGPLKTIQALSVVRNRIPGVKLDFVGDGPMMAECVQLAKSLRIDDAITFHGFQSTERVAKLLSKASLFVQHSIRAPDGQTEAFGITPLEASASEVPVVATKSGGIIEAIIDGETGLLVAEHDINGMAEAMIALLNNQPLAEAMGHAGRKRVKERFTNDRTAARLREIMGMPC